MPACTRYSTGTLGFCYSRAGVTKKKGQYFQQNSLRSPELFAFSWNDRQELFCGYYSVIVSSCQASEHFSSFAPKATLLDTDFRFGIDFRAKQTTKSKFYAPQMQMCAISQLLLWNKPASIYAWACCWWISTGANLWFTCCVAIHAFETFFW